MTDTYTGVAETIVGRILALIPDNPQILGINDVWHLFSVPGFQCDDLGPSLFQASWALATAKQRYIRLHPERAS